MILSALAAMLSGCGFHFAGSRPLPEPLQRVHIDLAAPYRVSEPPLETALRARLARRGAEVLPDARDAGTVIRLSNLRETREVLSVGADGKALEYLLVTRVDYTVISGERVWLPPDSLSATRDYSFSADQILPKEAEEDRLREFIQGELAELLLLRIETAMAAAVRAAAAAPAAAPDVVPVVTPTQ